MSHPYRHFFVPSLFALVGAAFPAQADAPTGRYDATMGTGTVFDTKTHLTWQQTAPTSGGDDGNGGFSWAHAKTYCTTVALPGTGWRLPTVKEIVTIADFSKTSPGPTLDTSANGFLSGTADQFWSATPYAGDPTQAWDFSFSNGGMSNASVTTTYHARCVRGG
jgi:hypothetical protein